MYTLLRKTMTKSQTSKNTQSAKQIVRQISGITSKRSVSSISGTRIAREEFDPTKEHDEMLTRLSEIKTLRGELDHEEKAIKSRIRKDLLSYQEDGDVPEIHHSQDEKLYAGFRTSVTYIYSEKLQTRIDLHAKETKLIKNKKDAEVLSNIAKLQSSKKTVVLYRP